MSIDGWDEIRTAFHVARAGTVSGAAEALGVHHATVIRHIDSLEKRLGVKLFQRHARGYTATEAGQDLMQVARTTDEQFAQLAGRVRGQGETVAGELVVTAIVGLSRLLTPALASFQAAHSGLTVRFLTDDRLFRLEYGEAHLAVRAGAAPDQPDNVVQPFVKLRHALFAAKSYAARHGLPSGEADLAAHAIVGEGAGEGVGEGAGEGCGDRGGESPAPFLRWLRQAVPPEAIRWRASSDAARHEAVLAGAGIGFLPIHAARRAEELIEVLPPREEWTSALWLVTHVDLHRTAKVQAALKHLKAAAREWGEL